jgi:hypothetical protein
MGNLRAGHNLRVQSLEDQVTVASGEFAAGAVRLAERLRDLREHAPIPLTQGDLGQALADGRSALGAVGPAAVSSWESPASGRLVPAGRLDAYARLFCTPRSFEGGVHLLEEADLTPEELSVFTQLKDELLSLRDQAATRVPELRVGPRSMWHSRLQPERRPPSANPEELNYVRFSGLGDLDALIEIYGAIRSYNPTSQVTIMAAQDLTQRDAQSHLVLIGGLTFEKVTPWLTPLFPIPLKPGDPADTGSIVVKKPDDGELEFKYKMENNRLVEDVGYFARGTNPSAPRRTLTICGGITTRGVRGVARCFVDPEMREQNEKYLFPRFPDGSTYFLVMRVPVLHPDPITPDLSKMENRLFEWCDSGAEAR